MLSSKELPKKFCVVHSKRTAYAERGSVALRIPSCPRAVKSWQTRLQNFCKAKRVFHLNYVPSLRREKRRSLERLRRCG
jgi:hypothetical protein